MNYYVYRIDNLITGEFYIGKRRSKKTIFSDNYMGSGKNIKENIKKYGIINFDKTLLALCDSDEELKFIEGAYINYHRENKLCLNMMRGCKLDREEKLKSEINTLHQKLYLEQKKCSDLKLKNKTEINKLLKHIC